MNRLLILLVFHVTLSLSTSLAIAQNRTDSIRIKILTKDNKSILVAAHRGYWRYSTENSLHAIKSAIDIGVDIIEVDVQRTRDGHLILMHDETLDRTTTGSGRVDSLQLDSIKNLYLKNGIGIKTKEKIPTLKEALLLAKDKVMINLDKADRYIEDVYELIRETGTQNIVIIKTAKPLADVRVQFYDHLFDVILMPIIDLEQGYANSEITGYMNFLKPKMIEFTYSNPDNPIPHKIGKELKGNTYLWYNTMWEELAGDLTDDRAIECTDCIYGYLIDSLAANVIQTDRPLLLLNYLRERGLHK